jgi:hypothetical protein
MIMRSEFEWQLQWPWHLALELDGLGPPKQTVLHTCRPDWSPQA